MSAPPANAPPLYPFPEELLRLPRDASAVIEASAGTGKTYLLEHLVVDRIIRGDARIDEILVVTFTEKATAELVHRLRAMLGRLLAHRGSLPAPADAGAPPERCWRLDGTARARLEEALRGFDRAAITTIHGFCQRVLIENPFASNRLIVQRHVDSGKAFGDAFKEALRSELAVDARLASYLRAWLATGQSCNQLGELLRRAHAHRRPFGAHLDEPALMAAAAAYAALPEDEIRRSIAAVVKGKSPSDSVVSRALLLRAACVRLLEDGDVPGFLVEIDGRVKDDKRIFIWVEDRVAGTKPVLGPPPEPFWSRFCAVADAAVPLDLAATELFLPAVQRRLEARKQAGGLYDFDDMLRLVADALTGPGGEALATTLRGRYRVAVIDEFQDTDAVQWEIFRTIFPPGGGSPLYVVGDPKQSIYGFRGADLLTYQAARSELSGGAPGEATPAVTLERNYRSTRALIEAHNAVFDPEADPPFFTDPGLYRRPAVAGRDDDGDGEQEGTRVAPVVLLAVRPAPGLEITRLPIRQVRAALTRAIADEIKLLRATEPDLALRKIFVLTRTNIEARQVAAGLRDAAIPHVIYDQEGLYATDEARHVRDLLAAVEDPRDPGRRMRAWLTPFFGLALGDLPATTALPAGHPLEERLFAWQALAEMRDWARLFDRIADESGVTRRELAVGGSARRLANYQQLFDFLRVEGTRTAASLGDLVRRLGALFEKLTVPAPEEGNVQGIEGDRDAVQIMTMHKAKGLEADHVFIYGAFSPFGGHGLKTYAEGGRRVLYAGRPRRMAVERALDEETRGENQRLLYVALTRARRRIYLPYAGVGEVEGEPPKQQLYWKIGGAYQHVHQRVRTLVTWRDPRLPTDSRDILCPAPPDPRAAQVRAALGTFAPRAAELGWSFPADALAERRRRHAGIAVTSYTRLKEARGATAAPPSEVLDEVDVPEAPAMTPNDSALPGGAAWGTFLHAVLEAVPLPSLVGGPALESWAARPEIAALVDAAMRRHDREARHRPEALRMIHAALSLPLLAGADRVAREVEFLFPFPEAAGGAARGFVKGYIDLIVERGGRVTFADWKSDVLPSFAPEAVAAHVEGHYDLQRLLYALALVRMLGIATREDYEARFGGTAYVFLRGLPDGGVHLHRPSWEELAGWERDVARELALA